MATRPDSSKPPRRRLLLSKAVSSRKGASIVSFPQTATSKRLEAVLDGKHRKNGSGGGGGSTSGKSKGDFKDNVGGSSSLNKRPRLVDPSVEVTATIKRPKTGAIGPCDTAGPSFQVVVGRRPLPTNTSAQGVTFPTRNCTSGLAVRPTIGPRHQNQQPKQQDQARAKRIDIASKKLKNLRRLGSIIKEETLLAAQRQVTPSHPIQKPFPAILANVSSFSLPKVSNAISKSAGGAADSSSGSEKTATLQKIGMMKIKKVNRLGSSCSSNLLKTDKGTLPSGQLSVGRFQQCQSGKTTTTCSLSASNVTASLSAVQPTLPPLPSNEILNDVDDDDNDNDDNEADKGQSLQSTSNTVVGSHMVAKQSSSSVPSFQQTNMAGDTAPNTISNNNKYKRGSKSVKNDNFVRLNMKNNAGACRGARNKKNKARRGRWLSFRNSEQDFDLQIETNVDTAAGSAELASNDLTQLLDQQYQGVGGDQASRAIVGNHTRNITTTTDGSQKEAKGGLYVSKMTGMDPLDEFVDGQFHHDTTNTKADHQQILNGRSEPEPPKCARHQLLCKLLEVKKHTTGNKGRKFYACSMPRGEQCDHFEWADDTFQSAREIIAKNASHSSFISRQVAAHVDRFRALTVPELKEEVSRRNLSKNGKKQQLLMRLAIWTRDEIVKSSPELQQTTEESACDDLKENGNKTLDVLNEDDDIDESSSTSSSCSSSDDELELFDGNDEQLDHMPIRDPPSSDGMMSLADSLRSIFGHETFREGQEWAIQRCLDKQRSLLVAPTGFGKSLCYALPAAMMDGVCVVVSPLISLIQDQLRSLPPRIPAATLSGSISTSMMAAVLDDVARKRIKILFVSPERLASPAFRRLFVPTWNPATKSKEKKFPEISLLCVDEAHCISQWAHNFRPCFLRFKSLLRLMEPKSVLAITATAGPRVVADIQHTLGIAETSSPDTSDQKQSLRIIQTGRDNIDVMCKFAENHDERLIMLSKILTTCAGKKTEDENRRHPYAGCLASGSVIVYVWRQKDTEVVAENLTAAGVSGGVVVYHGGMDVNARSKSQSMFMRGKARICVATVAFGLGIDKADVEGIIHLYLSNSPEHFLQEIGRAGRDGRTARAISLPLLEETPVRHSLVHSNLVTKSQIRALLQIIRGSVQAACKDCIGRLDVPNGVLHIALPVRTTVLSCDCKPETIETFLSLMELEGNDNPLLVVEGCNYDSASIALKKRSLKKLAERETVAATIQKVAKCVNQPISSVAQGGEKEQVYASTSRSSFQRQFLAYSLGSYDFSISMCANHLGPAAEPRHVFAAIRRLQSSNELEFALDTSEKGRIFHLKVTARGVAVFCGDDFEVLAEYIASKVYDSFSSSSISGASKVLDMHYILHEVAKASDPSKNNATTTIGKKSPSLVRFQELTRCYFEEGLAEERETCSSDFLPKSFTEVREKELLVDAYAVSRDLPHCTGNLNDESAHAAVTVGDPATADYTALAITKFLHGIDTPRTPAWNFRSHFLFGKHKNLEFSLVLKSVSAAVQAFKND